MENRLLNQFENVISTEWLTEDINEPFEPLNHRELFDLTYHTVNNVGTRCIFIKLFQGFKQGSKAIMYSKNKTFISIENLEDRLNAVCYYNNNENANRLTNTILPLLQERKIRYKNKEKDIKAQILKSILIERKIDECANLVMLKDINRKVYFAIGDARESAASTPIFMDAEGASLVQLALNKWMTTAQNLPPEQQFPEERVSGLLKNLMQIKRWLLNLISSYLDKED